MVKWASLSLALLTAACGGRTVGLSMTIIADTCKGNSPVDGATHLLFRVRGPDLAKPIDAVVPYSSHQAQVPRIPPGLGRTIEVRAYAGDPRSDGRLLSVGRSLSFDVSPSGVLPKPIALTVFLRRIGEWTGINSVPAPTTCHGLLHARAGHTATALPDGRIFVAGGYDLDADGGTIILGTSELLDPVSGPSDGPKLAAPLSDGGSISAQRMFHTGTALTTGQVLLAGGFDLLAGARVPLQNALVYDGVVNAFGGVDLSTPRAQHQAASFPDGVVLLAGGAGADGGAASLLDGYDPSVGRSLPQTASISRTGVAVAMLSAAGSPRAAIAGGVLGGVVSTEVDFVAESSGTFSPMGAPASLSTARRNAAFAPLGDGSRGIVIGGDAAPDNGVFTPIPTSEVVAADGSSVANGPVITPRARLCAVALRDGRVLTIGGLGLDSGGSPITSTVVELLTPTGATASPLGMPALPASRADHACALLADGSVLVAGGWLFEPPNQQILNDAWILMPPPLD